MRAEDSRLSLGDCSAFVAARDEGNSLLTGDKRLRDQAEDISLETHGVLWVLDEIEAAGLLNHAELAVSLQKILDEGARLPVHECERRFQRWSGTE
jgi:predicted nucleic acid-binding protein